MWEQMPELRFQTRPGGTSELFAGHFSPRFETFGRQVCQGETTQAFVARWEAWCVGKSEDNLVQDFDWLSGRCSH